MNVIQVHKKDDNMISVSVLSKRYETSDAKPVMLWTNGFCSHCAEYVPIDSVRPMTGKEIELEKQKRRDKAQEYRQYQEQKQKAEAERERNILIISTLWEYGCIHTAWQWLAHERRKIVDGAKPFLLSHDYYYYVIRDTEAVTDVEYETLKEKYIELYGGRESIELPHLKYNGK